jgi:putative two-component system response regulator
MARDIAACHHERFDGGGYPKGLAGLELALAARIFAVADVYDALVSKRIYKAAYTHDVAYNIILKGDGTQFDPDVVEAFKRCQTVFRSIHDRTQKETCESSVCV